MNTSWRARPGTRVRSRSGDKGSSGQREGPSRKCSWAARLTAIWPAFGGLAPAIAAQLEIDAKYAVYLDRQVADVASYRRDEALQLPDDLDYAQVAGLSTEVRQKLTQARPRTIGQAARIDGITPAALTLLVARVRRPPRKTKAAAAQ